MPMFPSSELKDIHDKHLHVLKTLGSVEEKLNARFYGMEAHTRALALAALSGEPLLLIGPPGTAKSLLIREFCRVLDLVDEDGRSKRVPGAAGGPTHGYFEYLLTRFTEPSELFGFYDISSLRTSQPRRHDDGMMQHAKVVYLDEVFNASSAILNALLAFMNERLFHDHGERHEVALEMLFGATNEVPRSGELSAFFDRFLIRSWVENVPEDVQALGEMIARGWTETYSDEGLGGNGKGKDKAAKNYSRLLDGLRLLREDIASRTAAQQLAPDGADEFLYGLQDAIYQARRIDASRMSNRRIVKLIDVMLLYRLYRQANGKGDDKKTFEFGKPEIDLIEQHLLDRKLQPNESALRRSFESMRTR